MCRVMDGLGTTDKNVKLAHSLIMCARRRSLRDIARQIGKRFGAVQYILTDCPRSQLDGSPDRITEKGVIVLSISCLSMRRLCIGFDPR